MLCWVGLECCSGARTHCLQLLKLLVSASELQHKFPFPSMYTGHYTIFYSEVDATNKNSLFTGVTSHNKNWIQGKQFHTIHFNASAHFILWVIYIYYESRERMFSDLFFFPHDFITGKMGRGCDCSYFHIPVTITIFKSIKLKWEFTLPAKRFLPIRECEVENFSCTS